MDTYDRLKFAALVHDFGKVWDRKNHVQSITDILKKVHFLCPDEEVNDIIKIIDKTHTLGNPDADYWLLKIADRKACELQRMGEDVNGLAYYTNADENGDKNLIKGVPEILLPKIQSVLRKQLWEHFILNDANVKDLKNFVRKNKLLDVIKADVNDLNESSLREHLLLTEKILDLTIKFLGNNPVKNFRTLQTSEKFDFYLRRNLKDALNTNGKKIDAGFLNDLIDGECGNENNLRVNTNSLSVQFRISTEEIKNLVDENKIILTDNGNRAQTPSDVRTGILSLPQTSASRTIIIPVSMMTRYMFCNYQPYLQYVKCVGKKIDNDGLKQGEDSHKQLAEAEDEKKKISREKKFIDACSVLDAVKKSAASEDAFTFHEVLLKSEVIPGIILMGAMDKLDVWKGRLILTERKFVRQRKMTNPYDNEIAQITAYAMLLKKNFGVRYEDMNCSIDLFDVASKQLIKKCVVEISEKNIASVKKTLWELGAVIVGAKIPQPTKNKNKCAVCLLNKKNLCDFGLQQS